MIVENKRVVRFGESAHKNRTARLGYAALALLASCATAPKPPPAATLDSGLIRDPVLGVVNDGTKCTVPAMVKLWRARADEATEDYPIGPGDELTVSVPEIDELQNQHARISQEGTLSLPLIGTLEVGGLDENQARLLISRRLATYMKEPRVELYVEQYRSRGVGVAGAVQKPGVYGLASFGDSLNQMLAMAGGQASYASQNAVFLPAGVTRYSSVAEATQLAPVSDSAPGATAPATSTYTAMPASRASITIRLGREGDVGCLNMPARPGDVIVIPAAGTVTVVGWVRSPGSFPISPGMTVLGAVTAAGGALFSWHAEVLRTDQNGTRVIKRFSLNDLEDGETTDIPVEAGDVVLVEKSVVGAVPYALWQIFQHFGAGAGIGIPIP
jgi:polysaccharide export outer membrane protein